LWPQQIPSFKTFELPGGHINIALLKVREENVAVTRASTQFSLAQRGPASGNAAAPVQEIKDCEVIDLDRFRVNTAPDPTLNMTDPAAGNFGMSFEASGPARGVYIDKYRQTQRNSYYLNHNPSFEIKF
jgi:hypothetical protein